jgi:two-component system phosphate regulon response regulator PhoB
MEKKKKVMIVEDDTVLANALSLALQNEGYELSLATDGEEAERMIQQEMPDLILLDLLLPIKNGFEVLKIMRQNPNTKDISVVILTNFEQETSISEGKKLGAKDYIVKANVDIQDIPEIVKKHMPA